MTFNNRQQKWDAKQQNNLGMHSLNQGNLL